MWEEISGSRKAGEKKGMREQAQEHFYFRTMGLQRAFNIGKIKLKKKRKREERRGKNDSDTLS